MVSGVSFIFVLVFYTSLNSCGYKIKLKAIITPPSRLIMMHIIWHMYTRCSDVFAGVNCKYPAGRDLNKCQIPAYVGLLVTNARGLPGREDGHSWI